MLTPGETAHVDQTLALVRDVEREWPDNQNVMCDSEVERVVLERVGEPWQGMRSDRAYVLFGDGRLVELPAAERMMIAATALNNAPKGKQECDRCRVFTVPAGVAVVAVPRNLVALVLCWSCVDHLNPESLLQSGVPNA